MIFDSVKLIYFSPTGTTRKILEGIAKGFNINKIEHIDLTLSESRIMGYSHLSKGIVVIGVPVYSGRVPDFVVNALKGIKGRNIPAIVVVVYGNRAYEDALIELRDLALEMGFKPIAGGAFIGEHSFSNRETPIASGRPDNNDIERAVSFGNSIRNKLDELSSINEASYLNVPGNFPYKEAKKSPKFSPSTVEKLCIECGKCTQVCPTIAVTMNESVITDQNKCIHCCSCIKNCPTGARVMDDTGGKDIANWLYNNCQERKEPETYVI